MAGAVHVRLADQPFDPEAELAGFRAGLADSGGLVSFTGVVRPAQRDEAVRELFLQHYPGMTEAGIAGFAEQAMARWPLESVLIVHRVGALSPGEPIVMVATASPHRRDAFEAADFLMDYLKSRAFFWKRETTNQASRWIEPRDADYADASRWEGKPHAG